MSLPVDLRLQIVTPCKRPPSGDGWLAIVEGGEAIALASYYSKPGRIERDLPHVLMRRAPAEICTANECCLGG